ncbi:type IV conjugative transfer system protein TraL [Legionella busanensis]|uniref:Type IV conjugative transfer system protein TraL n=1 Tax=Legionella busanensis TaxID=190655 RepID=A0A378KHI6_9GAMM|nr:type IV conjugative transfer system protein TraL [Legionella busanensis]STX81254.1 type IV conjugative transfer system protein TraL [Legionella busanensis]
MKSYKTFVLSDEPKILGIPVTTGIPVLLLTLIGLITGYATQLFLIGGAISMFMHFKFGGLPIRQFYGIVYWSLPRLLTGLIFRASPDSANRLYIR